MWDLKEYMNMRKKRYWMIYSSTAYTLPLVVVFLTAHKVTSTRKLLEKYFCVRVNVLNSFHTDRPAYEAADLEPSYPNLLTPSVIDVRAPWYFSYNTSNFLHSKIVTR